MDTIWKCILYIKNAMYGVFGHLFSLQHYIVFKGILHMASLNWHNCVGLWSQRHFFCGMQTNSSIRTLRILPYKKHVKLRPQMHTFFPLISLCSESSRACAVDAFSRRSAKNVPLIMFSILVLVYNAKRMSMENGTQRMDEIWSFIDVVSMNLFVGLIHFMNRIWNDKVHFMLHGHIGICRATLNIIFNDTDYVCLAQC